MGFFPFGKKANQVPGIVKTVSGNLSTFCHSTLFRKLTLLLHFSYVSPLLSHYCHTHSTFDTKCVGDFPIPSNSVTSIDTLQFNSTDTFHLEIA